METHMQIAKAQELDDFLQLHPEIEMLELLMPDTNGVLRCKRVHKREFAALFGAGIKHPMCTPLVTARGDLDPGLADEFFAGDPDGLVRPIAGTLATVPWLKSPTAQVLLAGTELDGTPSWVDPRNVLAGVLENYDALSLKPVIATEMEFYLVVEGQGGNPRPVLGKIPGTGLDQPGTQYCVAQDLWQMDAFLNDVRLACDAQQVPLTVIHSEFSPGQWEINTHHVDDPLKACDQAVLLKRIVKGVALKHGYSASFMAKPFTELAGSGMHIHASLYDEAGNNIFDDPQVSEPPAISTRMRHAIGGLAETMAEGMAVFAPNANSYRRFVPDSYAPTSPTWGYNHREVALRIPVSGDRDRRIEHRVAGADANPYLVAATVLAGIHHGISQKCDPGPGVQEGACMPDSEDSLPRRWDYALDLFESSDILPRYLGSQYARVFARTRRGECDAFHAGVSNLDSSGICA